MSAIMIYCTCPDIETADQISRSLVMQGDAACVNLMNNVSSVYKWEGKIEQSNEVLLMIKTVSEKFESAKKLIMSKHPYKLPEIIAVDITNGLPEYLDWINQCTN